MTWRKVHSFSTVGLIAVAVMFVIEVACALVRS